MVVKRFSLQYDETGGVIQTVGVPKNSELLTVRANGNSLWAYFAVPDSHAEIVDMWFVTVPEGKPFNAIPLGVLIYTGSVMYRDGGLSVHVFKVLNQYAEENNL